MKISVQEGYWFRVLFFLKRLKTDTVQEEAQKNIEVEDELHELRDEFQHQFSLLHDNNRSDVSAYIMDFMHQPESHSVNAHMIYPKT